MDDVENFNIQSLNALLKLTEEPGKNNYFILINNKSKTLPETIKSRCLEIKVVLSQNQVNNILVFLEKYFNQKIDLDRQLLSTSPGLLLRFNNFFYENDINIDNNFIKNLNKIMIIYKKEKNFFCRDLLIFFVDYYFKKNKFKNSLYSGKYIEKRLSIIKNINNFFLII